MDVLNKEIYYSLAFQGGGGLIFGLELTVIDDRKSLEGAIVDDVRERFKEWMEKEGTAEIEDQVGEIEERYWEWETCMYKVNPKYVYCIHVDEEAPESVVVPRLGRYSYDTDGGNGYVNIIDGR